MSDPPLPEPPDSDPSSWSDSQFETWLQAEKCCHLLPLLRENGIGGDVLTELGSLAPGVLEREVLGSGGGDRGAGLGLNMGDRIRFGRALRRVAERNNGASQLGPQQLALAGSASLRSTASDQSLQVETQHQLSTVMIQLATSQRLLQEQMREMSLSPALGSVGMGRRTESNGSLQSLGVESIGSQRSMLGGPPAVAAGVAGISPPPHPGGHHMQISPEYPPSPELQLAALTAANLASVDTRPQGQSALAVASTAAPSSRNPTKETVTFQKGEFKLVPEKPEKFNPETGAPVNTDKFLHFLQQAREEDDQCHQCEDEFKAYVRRHSGRLSQNDLSKLENGLDSATATRRSQSKASIRSSGSGLRRGSSATDVSEQDLARLSEEEKRKFFAEELLKRVDETHGTASGGRCCGSLRTRFVEKVRGGCNWVSSCFRGGSRYRGEDSPSEASDGNRPDPNRDPDSISDIGSSASTSFSAKRSREDSAFARKLGCFSFISEVILVMVKAKSLWLHVVFVYFPIIAAACFQFQASERGMESVWSGLRGMRRKEKWRSLRKKMEKEGRDSGDMKMPVGDVGMIRETVQVAPNGEELRKRALRVVLWMIAVCSVLVIVLFLGSSYYIASQDASENGESLDFSAWLGLWVEEKSTQAAFGAFSGVVLIGLWLLWTQYRRGIVKAEPWDPTLRAVTLLDVPYTEDSDRMGEVIKAGCSLKPIADNVKPVPTGKVSSTSPKHTAGAVVQVEMPDAPQPLQTSTLEKIVKPSLITILFLVRRAG